MSFCMHILSLFPEIKSVNMQTVSACKLSSNNRVGNYHRPNAVKCRPQLKSFVGAALSEKTFTYSILLWNICSFSVQLGQKDWYYNDKTKSDSFSCFLHFVPIFILYNNWTDNCTGKSYDELWNQTLIVVGWWIKFGLLWLIHLCVPYCKLDTFFK